jgi:hypothetical protein
MVDLMSHHYALPLIPAFLALFSCLALAETSSTASPASNSETGLEGVIVISPTHGGPIRENEPPSSPLAKKTFVVQQEDRTVSEFETDEQGRFRILLPPGKYIVSGKDPKHRFERYGPMPVEIRAGKMTQVKWDFDTGLR